MRITRRHVAAAAALVLAAASLPSDSHAESADEAAVKKAIDDLSKAMIAADKAKLEALVVCVGVVRLARAVRDRFERLGRVLTAELLGVAAFQNQPEPNVEEVGKFRVV